MNQTTKSPSTNRGLTGRFLIIVVLVILTSIPSIMVQGLIQERISRKHFAESEVRLRWGHAQTLVGPLLSIPYRVVQKTKENEVEYSYHTLTVLPETLEASGAIEPHTRTRGIYEVILYETDVQLSGAFHLPDIATLQIDPEQILWDQARVHIGVSDPTGIQKRVSLDWNEAQLEAFPSVSGSTVLQQGLSFQPSLGADDKRPILFKTTLSLKGSNTLTIAPVGKETRVSLTSPWSSPSFTGRMLPSTRTVSDQGFSSEWYMLDMNRSYPQYWTGTAGMLDHNRSYQIEESSAGVALIQPVDGYDMATRAAKYAFLFICATYAIMFFMELSMNVRIHPVQYGLSGIALCMFYVLLLAIMEHAGFMAAYLVATVVIVCMLSWFAGMLYQRRSVIYSTASLLTLVYGLLYYILQSEDYALLSGTIICTIGLFVAMIASTRISWYGESEDKKALQA